MFINILKRDITVKGFKVYETRSDSVFSVLRSFIPEYVYFNSLKVNFGLSLCN
jgi:hypothetical protein